MESSPIKLTRKRRRLSINFSKCVICQEVLNNVKLSKATSVGQKSLLDAAETRRDCVYRLLTDDLFGLEDMSQLLYHRTCFKTYTSKSNLDHSRLLSKPETQKSNKSYSQQSLSRTPSVATRKRTGSTDWSVCIVCSKKITQERQNVAQH